MRTALIVGSAGLVGGHVLNHIIKDTNYSKIKLFVRSVPQINDEKVEIIGNKEKNFSKDRKGANINSIRTKKSIQDCDVIIVKFGEKYKQWNAAFDAGYATALNKSMIVIHNDDHQHALKEIDGAAAAVASDQKQAFRILKYILQGSLK